MLAGSASVACLVAIPLTASSNPQMKLSVIILMALTSLFLVVGVFYFALGSKKS